ncbi:putative E3 ubiquitin-protein ligase XBAT35 isoform X1 [Syzygium oleosum]|uniref:putative E3 ubiquitin-protein ligase XBAT35 isoform X1 n=1 Tax=Syzygium oleosum TaxID=219896 RepID=UPI0011D22918|nr:putative E3 ubiquitin-protein ligase XBAT35 isoform X1 [Syzygium oleosum]
MGQQQSKDELVYQQVSYGNSEGIKALCREGAGLEWIDREGKTPLIVACMNAELYTVAKTLIELGANVNAYRPGRNGGTPLHHAAKRGLENTVKLLLSHGANALVINDDCQTPLDVARAKGYTNVVRTIEGHMGLFSGWLREFYGPGFLEVLAPQLLSRKVWVVIYPCGSRNPTKPFKLELAIYTSMQDAQPRAIVALWKANLEEPKFHYSDPSVTIVDDTSIPRGRRRRRRRYRPRTDRQTRFKFAPANERDRQQFQRFCDACKGIAQPAFLQPAQPPVQATAPQATAPPTAEDLELAMAINASIQSAMQEVRPSFPAQQGVGTSASTSWGDSMEVMNHSDLSEAAAPAPSKDSCGPSNGIAPIVMPPQNVEGVDENSVSAPSAPPANIEVVEDGPIQYPSIDLTPIDMSAPVINDLPPVGSSGSKEDGSEETCCVVCLDAPVEGACVPCGHMAGCMSCLEKVKAKKSGCPVCRTKIDQVIKLYTV